MFTSLAFPAQALVPALKRPKFSYLLSPFIKYAQHPLKDFHERESFVGDVSCVARAGPTLTEADCYWQYSSVTWSSRMAGLDRSSTGDQMDKCYPPV
jgi:hypothetical protein